MLVNKQDIITSIKNLDTFLKIPELKGAKPRLNNKGNPFVITGGFNMVFQLEHQNKKWAFRVWHVPMVKHEERYRKISKYLSEKKLPYFADFIYDEKGILVNGNLLDTIRMEWLDAKLFKEYIEDNLNNPIKLTQLASNFLELCKTLRENKISHGDLQEGNILIDKNSNIKLVDYDSVCIPEIEGQEELVTGLKGYQHPSRLKEGRASLNTDCFSELIIYLSILALSENSNLWQKYQVKDTQCLLFADTDFENFENSEIYNDLKGLSAFIQALVKILKRYLSESSYLNLLPFASYLRPPEIGRFSASEKVILQGKKVELFWNVSNADTISINRGIGEIINENSISIVPKKSTVYELTAVNYWGKDKQQITIKVVPPPKIIDFYVANLNVEFGKETQLVWDVENVEKVELHYAGCVEIISSKNSRNISPKVHTKYRLLVTALDGVTKKEQEITVRVFKKVKIAHFVSDLNFVIETLPIKLNWKVENASRVILTSNKQPDIDVTGKSEIEIFPIKGSSFYLKASNEMFSSSSLPLRVEVQDLPRFNPALIPILPTGKELLPSFEFSSFRELSETALSDSQLEFQTTMKPHSIFSLYSLWKEVLK